MTEYKPRYRWRATAPETVNQFSGYDQGMCFGRIYVMQGGVSDGQWWWTMNHPDLSPDFYIGKSGLEETAREASRRVEEMYDKAKAENWLLSKQSA